MFKLCRGPESNRYGYHYPQDFKSCASASSATPAKDILEPLIIINQCRLKDLNPRPSDYKSDALPTELSRPVNVIHNMINNTLFTSILSIQIMTFLRIIAEIFQ